MKTSHVSRSYLDVRVKIFRTCDTDTVDVVRDDTSSLDDLVQLRTRAMDDHGIQPNSVEETEAECKVIELVENCPSNLDDGELGGVRRVG